MNYKASTINQLGFLFRFFDRPFLEKKKDYRIHAAQEMKELNYHFAGTSLHVLKKSTTDIVFLRARCFKIRCPAKCCIFYENLFQVFGNTEWQHHSIFFPPITCESDYHFLANRFSYFLLLSCLPQYTLDSHHYLCWRWEREREILIRARLHL